MDFTPITQAVLEPVFWLLPVAVLVALLAWRRRRRGSVGEAAVSRRLRRCCAEVANDMVLRDGRGGLTQIDHLALTPDGLLVVETKNYGGLIFGQVHDRTWTQCIGRQRNKFQNPLRQNYGHIKAVQALVPGVPVLGLVVFMDRAQFPKGIPEGVTTLRTLRWKLAPVTDATITTEYRRAWDAVLAEVLTDRISRRAQRIVARHRKLGR